MDITFGVLSSTDLAIKYGTKVIKAIQAYRRASATIRELTLRIDGIWLRTEHQVRTLQSIAHELPEELEQHFAEVLEILCHKLDAAQKKLNGFDSTPQSDDAAANATKTLSRWKKTKLAVLESHIKSIVQDLESWHGLFDPSWLLIPLINNTTIDVKLESVQSTIATASDSTPSPSAALLALRKAIRNSRSDTSKGSRFNLEEYGPYTDQPIEGTHIFLRTFRADGRTMIVDVTDFQEADVAAKRAGVQAFTHLLSHIEPAMMKLLCCVGFTKIDDERFQILYNLPTQSMQNPKSLRSYLETHKPSLDQRFDLAKAVARATMSVHGLSFVHKNIRPETLLVFSEEEEGTVATAPSPSVHAKPKLTAYLAGFEQFRLDTDESARVADMLWDKNLYRHPRRQGIHPEDTYIMQHDIYSLGVCLLEIGVWNSFVYREGDGSASCGDALDIQAELELRNKRRAANEIKAKLIRMATELLPACMGEVYTEVVCSCLECLDTDRVNFLGLTTEVVNEAEESDEIFAVGIEYIDRIIKRLEGVSLQ